MAAHFNITFDLVNKVLKVTDDTVYSNPAIQKDILKVTGPQGIIYANAGYAGNDFASPDMDGSISDWVKSINLPLDVDGAVLRGLYVIEMKNSDGSRVSTTSKSYTFSYQSPVLTLGVESDVRTSVLTSTDNTVYAYGGVEPLSIVRAHVLTPPVTSGQNDITGTGATLTAGPNIWTRTWVASLTSTFNYALDSWNGVVWVYIEDELEGEVAHDVETDDLITSYYSCANALNLRYVNALTNRPSEAERLKGLLLALDNNFILYQWAKMSGADASSHAVAIYNTLQIATDCVSLPHSDDSVEVIPWALAGMGGGGSTNQWYDGAGVPAGALGADGDYYLNTLNGDVYKKTAGAWSIITNIKGVQGDPGAGSGTGVYDFNYNAGTSTASETETLAAKGIDPALTIPNVGDAIEIIANLTISQPANFPLTKTPMAISVRLKATDFNLIRTETAGRLQLKVKITRVSSTRVIVTSDYDQSDILLSSITTGGLIESGIYIQKIAPFGAIGDVVVNQITYNVQKAL